MIPLPQNFKVLSSFLLHDKLTVLHRLCNHKMTPFMLFHMFTLLKFVFVEDKKQKKTLQMMRH